MATTGSCLAAPQFGAQREHQEDVQELVEDRLRHDPAGTRPNTLRAVESEIDNRPRRVGGDRTPAELVDAPRASPDHQTLRR
ncbi:hypothetical protein BST13_32000 [Mycobacterium aquaticum]|uniref:Uncharacterized protein n=1 Tax=Mycobacterium aquaticum TaxID=1927124 RepID=A0A1X0A8F1_9MYCO|nr:hypothetical protein BST13_32000 [Mycobacterium aquaticum]